MYATLMAISLTLMLSNIVWILHIQNKAPSSNILFNNNFYATTAIATAAAPIFYAWIIDTHVNYTPLLAIYFPALILAHLKTSLTQLALHRVCR